MNVFTAVTALNKGWLYDISSIPLFHYFTFFFLNFNRFPVFLTPNVDVMDGFWVNDIIWR